MFLTKFSTWNGSTIFGSYQYIERLYIHWRSYIVGPGRVLGWWWNCSPFSPKWRFFTLLKFSFQIRENPISVEHSEQRAAEGSRGPISRSRKSVTGPPARHQTCGRCRMRLGRNGEPLRSHLLMPYSCRKQIVYNTGTYFTAEIFANQSVMCLISKDFMVVSVLVLHPNINWL